MKHYDKNSINFTIMYYITATIGYCNLCKDFVDEGSGEIAFAKLASKIQLEKHKSPLW